MGLLDKIRPTPLMRVGVDAGELRVHLQVPEAVAGEARAAVLRRWEQAEAYLVRHRSFKEAVGPVPDDESAPALIRSMIAASLTVGVAPMACLPGAMVEAIAHDLELLCKEAVTGCEGVSYVMGLPTQIFPIDTAADEEGRSVGLRVVASNPYAIYSSVGRIRWPPFTGKARAIAVVAEEGALAEAVGAALGSALRKPDYLPRVLETASHVEGVRGGVILLDGTMGVWGDIEIVTPTTPR